MSRIGKQPIEIPSGVTVTIADGEAVIAGPKGILTVPVHPGFEKKLELQGVGYRASLQGKDLQLLVGFSHPVVFKAPEGITFAVEKEIITITGFDAYIVWQTVANIRKVRAPELYKGKGIRYV